MRTAAICPTCATYTNALCVIYNGPSLTNINVATLDNLEDIIQNINNNLVPIYGISAPTNSAVYEGQIYIDNTTGDVYIATTVGGGSADWVQLAYQSAIPSTPSLDDVLQVGSTSTIAITIQDLAVSPTQTNTMLSDGNLLSDTTEGLTTNYHVNDIYVTDINTGDFLQIAIDNTQNQTITFPDTSGQLALISDTHLNLQEVTDNGNLTDNVIVADSFSSTPNYLGDFASLLGYIGDGTTAHGALQLKEDSDGTGFTSTITANIDLTADRTISIPDEDGVMILNVTANTLTIKDNLTTPTQSITVQPINVFIEDISNTINASYNVNNILVENTNTGNQLQINIDNLQNQTIDFPDTSGQLALLSDIPPSPVSVYTAIISQTGTNPPTADFVLQNTYTNPVTFNYLTNGIYDISCADFITNRTVVFFQQGGGPYGCTFNLSAVTGSVSIAAINSSGINSDNLFSHSSIEIRTY